MEDGLVRGNLAIRQVAMGVLILVVMEDGLVHIFMKYYILDSKS